jgi:hypothetical protein
VRPADRLALFAGTLLGRFLIGPPALHLAEQALPLELLLQDLEGLLDIVVSDEYLQGVLLLLLGPGLPRPSYLATIGHASMGLAAKHERILSAAPWGDDGPRMTHAVPAAPIWVANQPLRLSASSCGEPSS